ncbi:phosphoribosylanthranilate isomerase [SAR116 cluster bacterium]|nr:phosphoribosylanthranilate isomerase [SAR116 cluster bacterium]
MTEIKVCGIKREEDLLRLIDLNVTWAGFVFYKDSIRSVDYNHKNLFEIARNKIGIVGLFVNPRNEFISKIVQKVKPDLIQLHGSETPERCNEIKKMFGIPIMKAIEVENSESFKDVYKYEEIVDRFLFDSKLTKQKLQGNKTDTLNWDILKKYNGNKKWMLAGGLNHRNILEAIKKSNSKNIDVSSGVESSPGVKSKELINKFIHKIRSIKS